jgi:hypothetical protein
LGFLLVLVGGWASILGVIGLIEVARSSGYLTNAGWAYLLAGPAMVVAGVVILVRLHRRWGPAESYGASTAVFAWTRRSLIGLSIWFTVSGLIAFGIGIFGVIDGVRNLVAGHAGGLWTLFVGVVFLGYALGAGTAWVLNVRRLDHQDPLFIVDDGGVECAHGRFAWRDIDRVLQVTEVTGSGDGKVVHRRLAFVLRDETAGRPVERPYDDEDAALTPFGFMLGVTNCTNEANAALAAFGRAPVQGELSELVPAEPVAPLPVPAVEVGAVLTGGEPPPYWPPPPGWQAASPLEGEGAIAVHEDKHSDRGIRHGLLIVLGVVMVLVGGLLTIGGITTTSRNGDLEVAPFVVDLTLGLALLAGAGLILFRRLRRRGAPSETTALPARVGPGGTEL